MGAAFENVTVNTQIYPFITLGGNQIIIIKFARKLMKYYLSGNISQKFKTFPISADFYGNINILKYLKTPENDYLNFSDILTMKGEIDFRRINKINNNQYCQIKEKYSSHKGKVGVLIDVNDSKMILVMDHNRHECITIDNDYKYALIPSHKYTNSKLLNEYNLFKYYVNYLIYINSKQHKIRNIVLNEFIMYLYMKGRFSLTYWLHNIISKDYNNNEYLIKKEFIYEHAYELFLISSPLSHEMTRIEYTHKSGDVGPYTFDKSLMDHFVLNLIVYTKIFYKSIVNNTFPCGNCSELIHINAYGFKNWESSFIYPWEYITCKICECKLRDTKCSRV